MSATVSNSSTAKTFSLRPGIVLRAGLVAGALDGLAAIIVYGPVFGKATVHGIFKGIASAVFGKEAMQGGANMFLAGLIFHFTIACLFALAYGLLYPRLAFLRRQKWIAGILCGIFVWMMMNLVVLPIVGMHVNLQWVPVLKAMIILILCVGIPISLITSRGYSNRQSA